LQQELHNDLDLRQNEQVLSSAMSTPSNCRLELCATKSPRQPLVSHGPSCISAQPTILPDQPETKNPHARLQTCDMFQHKEEDWQITNTDSQDGRREVLSFDQSFFQTPKKFELIEAAVIDN
jgi:hypothetical protein